MFPEKLKLHLKKLLGLLPQFINFKDERRGIELANDTDFGLASYFYTRDINRIWRVSEGLEYGMVGVNDRRHF